MSNGNSTRDVFNDSLAKLCAAHETAGYDQALADIATYLARNPLAPIPQTQRELQSALIRQNLQESNDVAGLMLSPKPLKLLREHGITTVKTLTSKAWYDLDDIRGFGQSCLDEVVTRLDLIGLKLRVNQP